MGQNKKKVFVSYVKDNAKEVERICKTFDQSDIEYWIDRQNIEPGEIWKQAIKNAINKGAFYLACFSSESTSKEETYMNEELSLGVDILKSKQYNSGWLIPIKLSPCEIPQLDIGAGKTLQDLHYLNFHENWDIEMARLIDIIKREESPRQHGMPDDYLEKEYTYQGLKSLIESGNGTGFHNADLGHPCYFIGASDKASADALKNWEYADSPKKNLLFRMLSRLSEDLKKLGIEDRHFEWWYDFSEWRNFCKFAIEVYGRKKDCKRKADTR